MSDLPSWVWIPVLAGVLGIPAVTVAVLYRGALATGHTRRVATTVAVVAGTVWAAWIAGSALLANAGAYRQDPATARPWIAIAFAGAIAAALLATRIPVVARILADPATPARFAAPHTLRIVGGVFVLVMLLGGLPAVFALPAGLGDMAIGIAAPFVARGLARGGGRTRAVWFNALGIADLVVAVTLGFLTGLGPSQLLHVSPSTANVGLLPLALIPTTAVPLAIALHLVSLRRLRATALVAPSRPVPVF